MQYDAINSRLINTQLQEALLKAERLCRLAAREANTIKEATRVTLETASGKAAMAAQRTFNTAATAFDFYTRHYEEYAIDAFCTGKS